MGFRGDDRGVTVQVGAVLLFGMLIISMSMYQTTVVPTENEQVEYQHNQQIQEDMQSFRSAVTRADGSESTQSVVVRLGTQFPERALFVNPPAVSGTLRTEDTAGVEIRNARALDDETAEYWTSDTRTFPTNTVRYEPNYRLYQDAPTIVYENGVLYNEFGDANRVLQSGQSIVDGRRISLVAVDGDLSQSQTDALGVDVRPVSVSERTVTVDGDGDAISLVVPSKISPDVWQNTLLADEFDESDSDSDKYVAEVNPGPTSNTVEIVFEAGVEYDLDLAKVGVGTDVSDSTATYLTDVSGEGETIVEGGTQRLVVEVRDEFNNPVSGVTLDSPTVTQSAGSDDDATFVGDAETGNDGRAVVKYEAPTNVDGRQTATVDVGFGSDDAEKVEFEIGVEDSDGSGSGGDINPSGSNAVTLEDATIAKAEGETHVDVTFDNPGSSERTMHQVRFSFYDEDSQNGKANPPESVDFDGTATLNVRGDYVTVDRALSQGETTFSFTFYEEKNGGGDAFTVGEGDFFVLTVQYDDGELSTYFVAPEE